jgi:excisionase family DNA binding protein
MATRTVRRRISDGTLPAYTLGRGTIRIRRDELEAAMRPIPSARLRPVRVVIADDRATLNRWTYWTGGRKEESPITAFPQVRSHILLVGDTGCEAVADLADGPCPSFEGAGWLVDVIVVTA